MSHKYDELYKLLQAQRAAELATVGCIQHASPIDMSPHPWRRYTVVRANTDNRRYTVVRTKPQIAKDLSRQRKDDVRDASAIRPTAMAFEINAIFRMNAWPKSTPDDACCANENRNMNGGCDNCGDPCL